MSEFLSTIASSLATSLYETSKPYSEIFHGVAEKVFVWEDRDPDALRHFLEGLQEGKVVETKFLEAIAGLLYDVTPPDIRTRIRSIRDGSFKHLKVDVSDIEIVGSGARNTIVRFGDSTKVIGITRLLFSTIDDAVNYAANQKSERDSIEKIFNYHQNYHVQKRCPVIPDEYYVVFQDPTRNYRVMFIKQYLEGEIKDIFELTREELENILSSNQLFAEQFSSLRQAIKVNYEYLLSEGFDVLGVNNIAVLPSDNGLCLYILDPHYRDEDIYDNGARDRIKERLDHILSFVEEE